MKNMLVKKLIVAAIIIPSVAVSAFGGWKSLSAQAQSEPSCDTLTLVSGTATEVAGYTETDPESAPAALGASLYSGGSFSAAVATETVIPPWIDPSTHDDFSGSGAAWISSDASWPGGDGNDEGSPTSSQWRLFHDAFTLPDNATVSSAQVFFAVDNAAEVYLNGASIGTTGDVYGSVSDTSPQNFAEVSTASFTPVVDEENSLDFVVRNWGSEAETNPTGLLYKVVVDYCVPGVSEEDNVKVHVLKHLDGEVATASSSDNYQFPATWTYRAANQNGGATTTEEFVLGNNEGGAADLYGADSVELEPPAFFTVSEVTTGTSTQVLPVGASCEAGKYRLEGYRVSATSFEAAASAELQTEAPVFTDLSADQYVIVSNETCAGENELHVDSIVAERTTSDAEGTFEDGWRYVFNITVPTDEPNLSMKFLDWENDATNNDSIIPVANNMRISSEQADNDGATVMITAADTYSSPPLVLTEDLDSGRAGMQVQVLVEVRIPEDTDDGSYTTTYGVQTLPNTSS